MPMYGLICPVCNNPSEHIMGANDVSLEVKCPCCARPLTRELHRDWPTDGRTISISGDTCAGSFNYAGYDETLGCEVRGKQHREELAKQQGLVEYTPDPVMERYREDIRHVRRNSSPTDPQAHLAIRKTGREMSKKRQEIGMDNVMKRSSKKIEKALHQARVKTGA